MKRLAGTSLVALAVAAFLASLSLVSWRQRQALDTMHRLETIQEEYALEVATRDELESRIRHLESRGRVVPLAETRLGMHIASGSETFSLTGEGP